MRCFGVLLLWTVAALAAGEQAGRRAPGFALPDPEYKRFYDLQDYKGKVLLLDIMTTSCPHCMLLSTTLEQVKERYGEQVAVLSVVLPPDNQETVAKYISKNKITVPIVCDMGQMTISYLNARPDQAHMDVPHLFLIDQKGIIRNDFEYDEKQRSIFEGPALFAEIDRLLKKKD
ncbi:MAG: TlpA family protein disulfide reductase [Acidobacteriota bacterium]|nr:TlpA family protein disulfide reductase [Acidobacteriota bacterium]